MARRHLTLTLTLSLDEDAVRMQDDGSTLYSDALDEARTSVVHYVSNALLGLDPQIDPLPEWEYRGVTYDPPASDLDSAL